MPANTNKKIEMIRQYVESATLSLQEAKMLLEELGGSSSAAEALQKAKQAGAILASQDGSKVIEGVFDGQNMVGPDGKQYSIPANYASKSKLVEGDLLKLTIATNGSFIYKQIGPVERKRVRGKLVKDQESGEFRIIAEERSYRALTASITYFKGQAGNDVVILIPRDKVSSWAAVENIIHTEEGESLHDDALAPAAFSEGDETDAPTPRLQPENELPAGSADANHQIVPSATPPTAPSQSTLTARENSSVQPDQPDTTLNTQAATPSHVSSVVQFDDDKDEFEEI